jgi:hypothetical protein
MTPTPGRDFQQFWAFCYFMINLYLSYIASNSIILYNKIINTNYQAFAVKALLKYSKFKNLIEDKHRHAYNKYHVVKVTTDYSIYVYQKILSIIFDYRIEPMENEWISTSILIGRGSEGKTAGPAYVESYDFLFGKELLGGDTNNIAKYRFEKSCEIARSLAVSNTTNNILETMVVMKYAGKYIIRSFNKNKKNGGNNEPLQFPFVLTKNNFLTIEYAHPDMLNTVPLELNDDIFVKGNDILTPLFVRRALEYQVEGYKFDSNFVLNVMDSDLNNYQITGKAGGIVI